MESKLSRWCNGFLEASWLLALIATPLFFNIHSERVFEPDKLTLLRSIALLMAFVWIVKFVAEQGWQDLEWLKWKSERSIWRMPLVAPIFAIVVVYLISSLFSVAPRTSWLGSYQRLQGTYSTYAYVVIFAVIASTMRSRAQVQRMITMIIITSIPVAMYGLLQRFELDPLPWGGNTTDRIAGHMGNAIFVGAYLVIAIPLTAIRIIDSFYHILTDEELNYADVVRSSIYLLTIAIQLIATMFTQSRGPLLGLGIGLFAFVLILLVALRNATGQRFGANAFDYLMPLGYFVAATAALFISNALIPSLGGTQAFYLFGGLLGVLIVSVFILAGAQVGWRWLWATWLILVMFVGLVLVLFNVSNQYPEAVENVPGAATLQTTFDAWGEIKTVNRLGEMLNTEAGTSTVRLLIWGGVINLIQPHEPIAFPNGETDRWNFLRPLFGYGPESMYVAYNRFYPPELAVIEARNASPDRSHNETFDALVITGIVGFFAWQVLYLATFYQAFKSVGVVRSKKQRNLLIALWILGAVVIGGGIASVGGPVYLGVSIPLGSIFGLVIYLVIYALSPPEVEQSAEKYNLSRLIMVGLIAAMIAYYVEIHFGIAIAATRVHSFAIMGLIFVLGYARKGESMVAVSAETIASVNTAEKAAPPRRTRRVPQARKSQGNMGVIIAATILLTFVMVTLTFDFTNFTPQQSEVQGWRSATDLPSNLDIFQRSMMVNPRDGFSQSPYLYGVFVLSWFFGALLLVSEMIVQGVLKIPSAVTSSKKEDARAIIAALFAVLTLVGIAIFFMLRSGEGVTTNTQRVGSLLAGLWALLSLASAASLFVVPEVGRRFAGGVAVTGLLFALPLLIVGVVWQAFMIGTLSVAALYFLWDRSWNTLFTPLLTIGLGSYLLTFFYAIIHSGLIRSSFISPTGVNGQQLEGLERNIVEAERAGAYLSTFYGYVIFLLLLAGLAFAWKQINKSKQTGSGLAFGVLIVLLLGGFYLIDISNLNIIQADMTYKRGKPYDQQAGQLSRGLSSVSADQQAQAFNAVVSNWQSAVAIYERAVEMAPNEDFYYLWLGRAYLEESSVNQAEQVRLLETARERLLQAQKVNPLNTDHTANLARLNVRWGQLVSQESEQQMHIDDAKNYYRDALALSPQNSIIRNEFAGLLLSLDDDCAAAIEIYQESAEVDPFYDQTYYRLTETLVSCGQREGADSVALFADAEAVLDSMQEKMPERIFRNTGTRVTNLKLQITQAYAQAAAYSEALTLLNTIDTTDQPDIQTQVDSLREQIELAEGSEVIVEDN